jgi:hypothetical protein
VRVVTGARAPREFAVVLFASTHDALTAEQAAADADIPGRVIPRPASLGAGCGIALRLEPARLAQALEVIREAGIVPSGYGSIQDR